MEKNLSLFGAIHLKFVCIAVLYALLALGNYCSAGRVFFNPAVLLKF